MRNETNLGFPMISHMFWFKKMGKTGTQLNAYMRVHRQKINNHPCSEPFDRCAKEDYQVFPFLKLKINFTAIKLVK